MALRSPFPALISRSRPLDFIPLFPPFATSSSSSSALRSRGVRLLRHYRDVTVSSLKQEQEEKKTEGVSDTRSEWGKVSAVLFDMDGVLCNSEELSRQAAVDVFAEMGVSVTAEDFVPFMGTGEANFLGGVASVKGVENFNPEAAKKRFFEIYLDKYAKPESGIGFPGAYELIMQCRRNGLKVAVASSADRIKVDANLAAAGLPLSIFDAIVSADAFENLKPAPDIFIAASKSLNLPPSECLVIEDALAGVQAARAAQMRCIAVTTTLSMGALQEAGPSLIRRDIGNVSLHDILSGGDSGSHNETMQGSQNSSYSVPSSLEPIDEGIGGQSKPDMHLRGLQGSRRDIVRYGSLAIAFSCLAFAITNRKAMQYASPKGILNLLLGVNKPILDQQEESRSARIQQFVKYISDVESRGSAATVPEFPSKLDWLNTAPFQWHRDLKGKVVLLDFWTYCCINCMHVLPDLEFLDKKYNDKPFTVVGVHSAKFDNEKDLEAIRNAVLRYNISHPGRIARFHHGPQQYYINLVFSLIWISLNAPWDLGDRRVVVPPPVAGCPIWAQIVNDGDMYLWRALGISSWPTFVIISPNGKLLAQISGEGHRQDLDDLVEAALQFYGGKKILNNSRLPLALEKDNAWPILNSPLKFPGKLAIDVLNNRLFISDSNHNRIVVTDLEGNFIVQVGSTGEEGLHDGSFDNATFNRPQGLAYNPKKNLLYVGDTENHALREIDFVNETVRTLAGNGTKGSDYIGGGKGTAQVLNSPWDVCFEPTSEIVYIAMSGQHQIWEHNTLDGVTKAFSGDGFERNLNGSSSTSTSFAQPSGISLFPDSQEAYVADSESSSIRALDLKTGGSRLLAGGDPVFAENLFRFGDHDGIGTDALFQHPLGVFCGKDGQIYVTDSYNHKIKNLDPVSKRVVTIAGTGSAGFKDGAALSAQLSEPSGIVEDGNGKLFIADTNNSRIRYLDVSKKNPVLHTFELKGVQPPSPKSRSLIRLRRRPSSDTQIIKINGSSSAEGSLNLKISVPEGYHFSKEAISKFSVDIDPDSAVSIEPSNGILSPEGSASLHFRRSTSSPALGRINCKVYYCKDDEVCLYQSLAFEVPFREVVSESTTEITLPFIVKPKVSTGALQLAITNFDQSN